MMIYLYDKTDTAIQITVGVWDGSDYIDRSSEKDWAMSIYELRQVKTQFRLGVTDD